MKNSRPGAFYVKNPGTGVMRHADAGYEIAINCAHEAKLDLPMLNTAGKGAK